MHAGWTTPWCYVYIYVYTSCEVPAASQQHRSAVMYRCGSSSSPPQRLRSKIHIVIWYTQTDRFTIYLFTFYSENKPVSVCCCCVGCCRHCCCCVSGSREEEEEMRNSFCEEERFSFFLIFCCTTAVRSTTAVLNYLYYIICVCMYITAGMLIVPVYPSPDCQPARSQLCLLFVVWLVMSILQSLLCVIINI